MKKRIFSALSVVLICITPGWLGPLLLAIINFEYNYKQEHGMTNRADTMYGGTWGYFYLEIAIVWLFVVIFSWLIVLAYGKGKDVFNFNKSVDKDCG